MITATTDSKLIPTIKVETLIDNVNMPAERNPTDSIILQFTVKKYGVIYVLFLRNKTLNEKTLQKNKPKRRFQKCLQLNQQHQNCDKADNIA